MTAGIHALPAQRSGLNSLRGGPVHMNPERPGRARGGVPRPPDEPGKKEKRKGLFGVGTASGEAKRLMWEHRGPLGLGLLLMAISRLAGFVLPLSSQVLLDDVIGGTRPELLVPLALAVAGATVLQALTSFGLAKVVSVTAQRAIRDMRKVVQSHVIRLPVSYYDTTKSGVLISRIMNDPEGIRNLVGTGLIQLVGGLFTAVIAFVFLIQRNWKLTLATVAILLMFAGVVGYAFKKLRPIFRKRSEITADVTGRLGEALGGVRLVKVYTAENREESVFAGGVDRLFQNISSTITGTSAVTAFSTVIVGAISVLVILVGGRAILSGTMTVGELTSFIFLVGMMVTPLVGIASISTQVSEAFAGLDRIRDLREMETEDDLDRGLEAPEDLEGDVVFDDVSFEYEPDAPVLRNVSFHAPAGTTTALVGPSGAGKSTLIGLVMAFARPQGGRVLVDGKDLTALRLRDYRSQIGVVLQDNFLFDGTIRENIAFSRPDATEEEIREAGRIAHCDEFVSRFEDGYDTVVGERGVKLSGGQRQRVAIARAILADPRILILDEATSSLDSESEALIRDGLRKLRRGRTTFVIAHRLSTITSADQILVMEEGRIVERGNHRELIDVGGLYRRLYERQHQLESDLYINPGEDPSRTSDADVARDAAASVASRTSREL
ncbi:MAG TPA: ABC transporter ATP-binding protein [Longimicrobiales bacterium]|nr:ABC transporter ATP-binding protein [Longimicrobiales bacterium]